MPLLCIVFAFYLVSIKKRLVWSLFVALCLMLHITVVISCNEDQVERIEALPPTIKSTRITLRSQSGSCSEMHICIRTALLKGKGICFMGCSRRGRMGKTGSSTGQARSSGRPWAAMRIPMPRKVFPICRVA